MIARRIHHHFFPHFLVDTETARSLAEPHRVHHWAHALSLKSLFVYLQLMLVIGVGLFVIRTKAPQILGTVTFGSDQIVSLTNQKRSENGLPALTYNAQLASAAGAKAADMFANDYWAHNSPSGRTPWSFITAAGYKYVYAGENLARDFDDAGTVVDAWMNSSSHRSNLLDKNFKEIGVAVQSGKLTGHEGILVVQEFGAGVAAATPPAVAAKSVVKSPVVSPSPSVSSPSPSVSPSPAVAVAQIVETTGPGIANEATILASRKFSIAKMASLSIIGFIFLLFSIEILVTLKREKVYLRSGIIAHLLLLGFVLLAVWYAVSGAIL